MIYEKCVTRLKLVKNNNNLNRFAQTHTIDKKSEFLL